uniref:Uncharacterized protein n=1 Tax=Arion vulgaris TaxID=1028688 RepID=A0A0B7BSY7_9EUPU
MPELEPITTLGHRALENMVLEKLMKMDNGYWRYATTTTSASQTLSLTPSPATRCLGNTHVHIDGIS